jgi:hypothetical protein
MREIRNYGRDQNYGNGRDSEKNNKFGGCRIVDQIRIVKKKHGIMMNSDDLWKNGHYEKNEELWDKRVGKMRNFGETMNCERHKLLWIKSKW